MSLWHPCRSRVRAGWGRGGDRFSSFCRHRNVVRFQSAAPPERSGSTRQALRCGLKVETPLALLEVITGQMIEAVDQFANKLADHLDRAEEKILAEDVCVDRQVITSATHDRALTSSTRDAARNHPSLRA